MNALPPLTVLLLATAPCLAQQGPIQTTDHENEVRAARSGDEGSLRYGPSGQLPPPPPPPTPGTGLGSGTGGGGGTGQVDPGPLLGIRYDVATGLETRYDLPRGFDPARWVAGREGEGDSSEPVLGWDGDLSRITSQTFPWSAQVRIKGQTSAGVAFDVSGTLIDARHVITCGHNVHSGAGGTWHNSIYVYPAWDGDDDAYGSAWASSYATFTGWTNSSNPADDIGFLTLDRPVGFMTGWFGYGFDSSDSFYSSNYFNLAGYPDASTCYSDAPDALYYGFGLFDSVGSGLLHADSGWSCEPEGLDGSGSYVILSGDRHVYATHRRYDPLANFEIEQTRLKSSHISFYENTVVPGAYSQSDPDYVPLDVQVDLGGDSILAGDAVVSMDYLVGNASLYDPQRTQTHVVEVYLSTNSNISTFDTLIQTHTYDYDYDARGFQRVQVAVPPTIPADTPSGTYWIGVITKNFDANSSNNDTDGRDAFQIEVSGCRTAFDIFGEGLPGSGGFAPLLYGVGSSCEQGGHSVNLAGALGGARTTLWIGFDSVDIPTWGGHFYVDLTPPFFSFNIKAQGPNGVPGVGYFNLPGGDIREFAGLDMYLQVSVLDPGAVQGISLTNGMKFEIQP